MSIDTVTFEHEGESVSLTADQFHRAVNPERRILKIKVKKATHTLVWEQESESGWDTRSLESDDTAAPEFYAALKALARDVVDICELPARCQEGIEVLGVSYSYTDNDDMGASISALRRLSRSNSPLVLNTPYKVADGSEYALSSQQEQRLRALERAALSYIDGERAQSELPMGEEQVA